MSKKSRKKKRRGGSAAKSESKGPATEAVQDATAQPAATPLGTGRVLRKKVRKASAKEQAALAKQAARARWAERMTAEGR